MKLSSVDKKPVVHIEPLRSGNWHSWFPTMKMILQSNGSLDKWLTPEYAELIKNDKKLSPLEKYEKLHEDKEALGLIRLYLSEPLQKLTENTETTVEIWELLKSKSTIINPEAIEYLERSLWALKLENLGDSESHIQQFNDIVSQLRDNNVQTQEAVLVSAALKAWPKGIETHKHILQASAGVTLQTVQDKLRSLALIHLMRSATEELETKTAHVAIQGTESTGNNNGSKKRGAGSEHSGAFKHLRDFNNLSEVPQRTIAVWEQHLDPNHDCPFGNKCWFRANSNSQIRRPPIIRKFLENHGRLHGNDSEDMKE